MQKLLSLCYQFLTNGKDNESLCWGQHQFDGEDLQKQQKPGNIVESSRLQQIPSIGAAMIDNEPLLTDLIPKRLGTYWLIFIFGLAFIGGLEYCFYKMSDWAGIMNVASISAFDVSQHGNLSGWFVSTLWLIASLYAAIVYKINRNEDDWRRLGDIWIWVALLTLFLSIDRAAGFHLAFRDLMIYATGTELFQSGTVWWLSIYTFVFIMVGSRILAEMRSYLPACNALLMCGICHIITVCANVNLIYPEEPMRKMMVLSGSDMAGNLFLVISFGLYGRYLIIGDILTYQQWNFSLWHRLTRRFSSNRYRYQNTDYDYDYADQPVHYRKNYQRNSMRNRRNWTADEDEDEMYAKNHRSPHYSQKRRLKNSQRGVFY